MAQTTYDVGTGLAIPGLEAVMEYGSVADVSKSGNVFLGLDANGRIYGAQRINDRSVLEQVHVTEIDGLYDNPDSQEVRTKLPSQNGERGGLMTYAGRTIGLTGDLRAGSINAVRDVERRWSSSLTETEQALLIHPPGEVAQMVNACPDPLGLSTSTYGTRVTSSGTLNAVAAVTDGLLTASELSTATNSTGAGSMYAQAAAGWIRADTFSWLGQDLWVHARVKVQAASAAVSSVDVRLVQYDKNGTATLTSVASQASPVTGTSYSLSGVVAATSLLPTTVAFSVVATLNYGAAGAFTLRWTRVALVPVPPPGVPIPTYFDGTFPGFQRDGAAPSSSRGPTHVANQVQDPLGSTGTNWAANNSAGATVNTAPTTSWWRSGLVLNNGQPASAIYYKATNPSATSRVLALATNSAAGNRFLVATGRTYLVGISLSVVQMPAATPTLQVVWLDQSGATITTSNVANITATGIARYTGTVIAPAGSVAAYMQVASTTAVSGAVLEVYATRAMFCDSTEHGRGIVGDEQYAIIEGATNSGARAPIKRPFLVRRVRKASYSCPEKQGNSLPRRDFTMSLRASDPRLYWLDERNVQLTMSGSSNYHRDQPLVVASGAVSGNPPTGYTADATPTNSPTWQSQPPSSTYMAAAIPATSEANSIARYYYSALTYQRPHVQVLGLPNPFGGYSILTSGAPWPSGIGAVLKRTSATNYITARWKASYNGPYSGHELEIAINTGAGESVVAFADRGTPFYAPVNLITWLDASNTVVAQVVDPSVATVGSYPTYLSASYQLTSAQITALGATVSGNSGVSFVIGPPSSQINGFAPSGIISSASFRRDDVAPSSVSVPVMGDVDTPQRLLLAGDLLNPVVSLAIPGGASSQLVFNGTMAASNPITVDYNQGTIIDAVGANRFGMIQAGSKMTNLQPGLNTISVVAENWGVGPHVVTWWRDARK